MHTLIAQYSKDLLVSSGIDETSETKAFEYFCNYVITSKYYFGRFSPVDVTTQEDDASLDGIAFIIDGDLITTIGDAESAFNTYKSALSVDILITQAKSGESFLKDDISNFSLGISDFLSLKPKMPNGLFNCNAIEILKTILKNVRKIKGRSPNLHVYYCTSGVYRAEREISAAFDIIERNCIELDLFQSVSVNKFGRKELIRHWQALSEKNEASLKVIDYIGIKENPKIKQAYIAIANAKDYIDSLVVDSERKLREGIFEENVRAYLGDMALVNSKISKSIKDDDAYLFSILNNGITIIAKELAVQPNNKTFDLTNYQVINGCQTTHTLYANYDCLSDEIEIPIKLIELNDIEVANKIVTATNSQTQIEQHAFLGLTEKARLVQKYFDICNSSENSEKIFFERRFNEYSENDYQSTRIFDVKELARCYIAVFQREPHSASRYVKKILKEKPESIFNETDHEDAYYTACLICYKYNTLINGRKLNANCYNKLRWHIAMIYPWVIHEKVDSIQTNSRKMQSYCRKVLKSLSNTTAFNNAITKCHEIIDSIERPTDDKIKRGKYTADLTSAAEKYLSKK
ncbi:AIPR family protein [Shewanella algae]|uniref:AIPR family protein n=1 Tax=Shewanella algae TaxID=38313 RepID=UPI0031F50FE4